MNAIQRREITVQKETLTDKVFFLRIILIVTRIDLRLKFIIKD